MNDQIQDLLDRLQERRGIRILLAVESGSQAEGFRSEDSDYDLRFIHVHERSEYLRLWRPADEDDLDAMLLTEIA